MAEKTYRIGEAARLLELETYVLRFWETEFTQLEPLRTAKGQRLYTEAHLRLLRRIRSLLHEQGLTIEGARRVLAGAPEPGVLQWEPLRNGELLPSDKSGQEAGNESVAAEGCLLQEQNVRLKNELCRVRSELLVLRRLLRNEMQP